MRTRARRCWQVGLRCPVRSCMRPLFAHHHSLTRSQLFAGWVAIHAHAPSHKLLNLISIDGIKVLVMATIF